MKFRTTNKELKNGFGVVVAVGYCGAQDLFNGREPVAYTAGVYGWNADIYTDTLYRGIAVATGYRPTGSHKFDDIVKEFNDKARKIVYSECPAGVAGAEFWANRSKALEQNRAEFFKAVADRVQVGNL